MDAILILKLIMAPILILGASFAGSRWGHTISGWLVSLPLNSAPVIFLLALEQGPSFASSSAEGIILGLASLLGFSLAYSWLSLRLGLHCLYSMILGWIVFFFFSFLLENVSSNLILSFIGVTVWLLIVERLFPRAKNQFTVDYGSFGRRELVIRVVAATSLIILITTYAPLLGPKLSGLLTPFPIYTSVLAWSIHHRQGAGSSVKFVHGATFGLFTSAIFFLVVGSLITSWGVGVSYITAISLSIITHGFLLRQLTLQSST